jgi:catechol 2,3-dioxygenase-like lactoylglutathione lyase family enzyme
MPNPSRTIFSTVSSRAERGICFSLLIALVVLSPVARAQTHSKRPRILGIAEVRFFSTDLIAARNFYAHVLGFKEVSPNLFSLNPRQNFALFEAPSPVPSSLLAEVVFETDNLRDLAKYLTNQKIEFTPRLTTVQTGEVIGPGYSALSLTDPEGHKISFKTIQHPKRPSGASASGALHIIHAGIIVKDRPAMEHFYKDILGFRPYWHGGRTDDRDDWVSLQVPDGSDWVEFMLNVSDDANKHLRGVMNHIALGVRDIQATRAQLIKNDATLTEEPKLGRDGKWQLNVYDPDETRIEFMEFTPSRPPCCSEFTAPHPKP